MCALFCPSQLALTSHTVTWPYLPRATHYGITWAYGIVILWNIHCSRYTVQGDGFKRSVCFRTLNAVRLRGLPISCILSHEILLQNGPKKLRLNWCTSLVVNLKDAAQKNSNPGPVKLPFSDVINWLLLAGCKWHICASESLSPNLHS